MLWKYEKPIIELRTILLFIAGFLLQASSFISGQKNHGPQVSQFMSVTNASRLVAKVWRSCFPGMVGCYRSFGGLKKTGYSKKTLES